jgi:hypothetical protein
LSGRTSVRKSSPSILNPQFSILQPADKEERREKEEEILNANLDDTEQSYRVPRSSVLEGRREERRKKEKAEKR